VKKNRIQRTRILSSRVPGVKDSRGRVKNNRIQGAELNAVTGTLDSLKPRTLFFLPPTQVGLLLLYECSKFMTNPYSQIGENMIHSSSVG
jgi:hypothetical protein